tara:strand:+ start:1015 stop:1674 length:660 start_codon:yes stop_codon:yes gene_type:complete
MHNSIEKLIQIEKLVKSKKESLNLPKQPRIIAVSKTFKLEKILPLIEHGHLDYGENKVQEAIDKWSEIKLKKPDIKLHLIGKLQTNKVRFAVKLFDYIHSLDNEKLAKKIADEQEKQKKKIKLFIQVNIGEEIQKSGLNQKELENFYFYCQKLNLDIIGLMCLPPNNVDPVPFFKELKKLNDHLQLSDLSMGMSSDFIEAVKNSSTFLRIGSNIFGQRS